MRRAARVLLFDERGSILLFRGIDTTRPDAASWWFTPGGGLESGESMRQAAIREVSEETGLTLSSLDGPVYEQEIDLIFEGVDLHQSESFFVAHERQFVVTGTGRTALEQRTFLDSRWWSADEIDATSDVIYPECLADLVRAHSAGPTAR